VLLIVIALIILVWAFSKTDPYKNWWKKRDHDKKEKTYYKP